MQYSILFACMLAASLATAGGPARAGDAVVTLESRARVPSREFTLGEVARVEAHDAATIDALASLRVGRAAAGGRPSQLTRTELSRYVARHLPPGIGQVEWQGSDAVQVHLRVTRIDAQALVERAAADLRGALEPAYAGVDVRIASRPDALRLPDADVSLATRLMPDAAVRPQRRMRVDVDVHAGGTLVRTVPLWFEVQALAPRWVARRDLPVGHALATIDFERRTVDVAKAGVADFEFPAEPAGWRLRGPLRAGSALSGSDLEDLPWISRHDDVTVEVRSAGVVIESRGTALADGRAGDLIPVRIPGADMVRGRVIGLRRLAL